MTKEKSMQQQWKENQLATNLVHTQCMLRSLKYEADTPTGKQFALGEITVIIPQHLLEKLQ